MAKSGAGTLCLGEGLGSISGLIEFTNGAKMTFEDAIRGGGETAGSGNRIWGTRTNGFFPASSHEMVRLEFARKAPRRVLIRLRSATTAERG